VVRTRPPDEVHFQWVVEEYGRMRAFIERGVAAKHAPVIHLG
jgi:hypothetical protein